MVIVSDTKEINQFKANKYWNQVNLDVDRSHRRFPHGKVISPTALRLSLHLMKLINSMKLKMTISY